MRANSRSSARGVLAGLMLAVPLALLATPVASASAEPPIKAFPGGPITNDHAFAADTLSPTVTLDQPLKHEHSGTVTRDVVVDIVPPDEQRAEVARILAEANGDFYAR